MFPIFHWESLRPFLWGCAVSPKETLHSPVWKAKNSFHPDCVYPGDYGGKKGMRAKEGEVGELTNAHLSCFQYSIYLQLFAIPMLLSSECLCFSVFVEQDVLSWGSKSHGKWVATGCDVGKQSL